MVARGFALLLLFNVEGGRYLAEQIPGARYIELSALSPRMWSSVERATGYLALLARADVRL
jgi:hypothetical protein